MAAAVKDALARARADGNAPVHVTICPAHWKLLAVPIIAYRPASHGHQSVLWARSPDGFRMVPYRLEGMP